MDPTIKQASKLLAQAATERLCGRNVDNDEAVVSLLLCVEALGAFRTSTSNATLKNEAKQLRRALLLELENSSPLPKDNNACANKCDDSTNNQEPASKRPRKELDFGQYAHTDVFDGNSRKAEKFARLMGGAKTTDNSPPTPHATFAPPPEIAKDISQQIGDQYNLALQHKGKRGLGL